MKRIAVITGNIVDNVVTHEDDYVPGKNEVDVTSLSVGPGFFYVDKVFSATRAANVGNTYFGKRPLATKDFFALAGQTLGSKYPRLRNDDAFLWVYDVLLKVEIVDVDDKAGQFLKIAYYLTHTNGADGQLLLSANDLTAIMAAWPST